MDMGEREDGKTGEIKDATEMERNELLDLFHSWWELGNDNAGVTGGPHPAQGSDFFSDFLRGANPNSKWEEYFPLDMTLHDLRLIYVLYESWGDGVGMASRDSANFQSVYGQWITGEGSRLAVLDQAYREGLLDGFRLANVANAMFGDKRIGESEASNSLDGSISVRVLCRGPQARIYARTTSAAGCEDVRNFIDDEMLQMDIDMVRRQTLHPSFEWGRWTYRDRSGMLHYYIPCGSGMGMEWGRTGLSF